MTYKILKYPTPENVNPSLFKAIKDENLSMGVGLPPEFPYPCQGAYKTWHFITHNRDKIEEILLKMGHSVKKIGG